MRSTASKVNFGKYRFAFSWDGPYGHVVALLEQLGPNPGVVLDVGCGYGAVAEPLAERGFTYCAVDIDQAALEDISARGHEAHCLDLREVHTLPDRLGAIIGDRNLSAILALDVIEHLVAPECFLGALRATAERHGTPPLLLSVPNVGHADLGAKLAFGYWDYTDTGLLDRTHVSFFNASRLSAATCAAGYRQVAAYDFKHVESDQSFPAAHPAVWSEAPIARMIRLWRDSADPHGQTIQFIRAFLPASLGREQGSDGTRDAPDAAERELTVLMRTQGRRPQGLREALTCLASQTADSFDVLILVHTDETEKTAAVREIVAEFEKTFASRVDVVRVPSGGGRARPLNVGLERVTSKLVAFLDDDDLVTADWVETFCSNARGSAVVRAQSAVRRLRTAANADDPYVVDSGLEFPFAGRFELTQHVWKNQTPICAYAVPKWLIDTFGLRFDEDFAVLEDWEFLLRCAGLAPVHDTGMVTSIVQLWVEGESSRSAHSAAVWKALERMNQERMNERPLLLPPGAVMALVDAYERATHTDSALRGLDDQVRRADYLNAELKRVAGAYDELLAKYRRVVGSKRWRLLGPPARALHTYRTLRARARRN